LTEYVALYTYISSCILLLEFGTFVNTQVDDQGQMFIVDDIMSIRKRLLESDQLVTRESLMHEYTSVLTKLSKKLWSEIQHLFALKDGKNEEGEVCMTAIKTIECLTKAIDIGKSYGETGQQERESSATLLYRCLAGLVYLNQYEVLSTNFQQKTKFSYRYSEISSQLTRLYGCNKGNKMDIVFFVR